MQWRHLSSGTSINAHYIFMDIEPGKANGNDMVNLVVLIPGKY